MNADDIRSWCMQQPRPHAVRCTNVDGLCQEVLVQGPWTKVGETIHALRPELLEALTVTSQLIRALRPNDVSDDWTADEQPKPARAESVPLDLPIMSLDPESQRFALFAKLVAEAYRHSTDVAFARLVDVVDASNRRAEIVERAREAFYRSHVRQLEEQIRSKGEEPEGGEVEGLNLQTMLGALFAGMGGGGGTPPATPPAPNGKAHS